MILGRTEYIMIINLTEHPRFDAVGWPPNYTSILKTCVLIICTKSLYKGVKKALLYKYYILYQFST